MSESTQPLKFSTFQKRVEVTLTTFGISGRGVVAVSGGADSVALLRSLAQCPYPLVVAHLNHGLRNLESDADAEFVIALSRQLGLPCICEKITLPTESPDGIEVLARQHRYAFLTRVAKERGSSWVAVGHTSDDHVETIVHRFIRGTGIRGLAGIPPQRELDTGLTLIRPLLQETRSTVLEFLHGLKQPWREDSSNFSDEFTRNRIRHTVLPQLRELNPNFSETILGLATQAEEISLLESWIIQQLRVRVPFQIEGDTLVIKREELQGYPLPILRLFWRSIWEDQHWPTGEMTFVHWQRLAEATQSGLLEQTDFPSQIRVRCTPVRMKLKKLQP